MPTTTDTRRHSPDGTDTALLGRYLIGALGAAAIGLGAALVVPRRQRAIIGGTLLAAGYAMLARGLSGRWPTLHLGATLAPTPMATFSPRTGDAVQGEGDDRAARSYDNHVRDFVSEGKVEPAAFAAAAAIDDPELPGLRSGEKAAKPASTTGHF